MQKTLTIKELSLMSKKLNLLYVEDDMYAREATLQLLKNFFNNITTAVDGLDALKKFDNDSFDLVLSDINMPNLDGLDMVKLLREKNQDIPILMLSAYNDVEFFLSAIELDVDGYLLKPLSVEKFTKTLLKVIRKIELLRLNQNYKQELEDEVKRRNKELEYKLHYDSLTELCSRYSFFKDIEELSFPTLLLVDINKFKVINEVYGNSIGSKVLIEFANRLKNSVDTKKYKLYRLSSDEFAIVNFKKQRKKEKSQELIENLLKDLNNLKLNIEDNIISIDITIGVSNIGKNSYENAKIALDYAKEHKRSFEIYSLSIDHRDENSLTLKCKNFISSAIDEDRVVAVYQPIVNKEGETIKYETLMRLRDKNSSKLITPFHFLEIAIKTRLYDSLSSNIIFKALNILKNSDKTLSINFTYSDITNSSFINEIKEFFEKNKEIGSRTVFEITESETIENYDDMKQFISSFRKYGVKIAIDDFGSGFSNFEYILSIEPDYLKIDGSLVKDIDSDERAHTLVEAIVQFSHKLNIKVIAEYVHSQTIFEMLKRLDVDEYQGFYFSEPLEKPEFKFSI